MGEMRCLLHYIYLLLLVIMRLIEGYSVAENDKNQISGRNLKVAIAQVSRNHKKKIQKNYIARALHLIEIKFYLRC